MGYKKRLSLSLIMIAAFIFLSINALILRASENNSSEEPAKKFGGGYAASEQLEDFGYTAKIYDANNNLPTSDANYILSTESGYLYFGCYSGILKYDGSVFERLNSADGLTSGRCLFEDSQGRIWVGTNDNGIVCIDGNTRTQLTEKNGLPELCVRAIAEDNKGNIIVGTTSGVAYIDGDMTVTHIEDSRIDSDRTVRLTSDSYGNIYGYCGNGYVFSVKNCKITEAFKGSDLAIGNITTILADPNKSEKVYIGTDEGMVYYGDFGDTLSSLKKINVSPLDSVYWLSCECDRVWLSSNSNIGYLDDSFKFHVVNDVPMNSDIEMITSDYQGNLWVASSTQGVMKIIASNFYNITRDYKVDDLVVYVTYIYNDRLYVGSESGLYIFDKEGNVYENELTNFIGDAKIRHIIADSQGNIWVSCYTDSKGLVCQKPDGQVINFTTDNGLSSNEVRCVCEQNNGTIVVGGNAGLNYIKDYEVVSGEDEIKSLSNERVLSVLEHNNELYVGTDGDGIFIITNSGIRWLTLNNGLTSDIVMRIKYDEFRDVIWLITSNSIQYIKNDVVLNVTSFPYNNCYDLYFDHEDDEIWILASNGIYCVDGNDMVDDNIEDYRHYTLLNGLPSIPIANGYSGIDENGDMFVACRRGVCKFNIDKFVEEYVNLNIGVRKIICDGEEIYPDGDGLYTIPSDAKRVSFVPAILDYSETNPNIHMCLEGMNDEGITGPLNDINSLEYTGIKYGTYSLHIQILNSSGNKVIQEEYFSVKKEPRFFEYYLVQLVVVFLIAVLGGILVWQILNKTIISKQNNQLQEAKDEVERANSFKNRFIANISSYLRTPLITILGSDEMILRRDPTVSSNEYFFSVINDALDIKKSAENLLGLIDSLINISKIESGKMALEEKEYETVESIRAAVSVIRHICIDKGLSFDVEIDEKMPKKLYGDIDKNGQIVMVMLSNAVKYTSVGGILLRATVEDMNDKDCYLRISVKDSGIGVPEELQNIVFESFDSLGDVVEDNPYEFGLGMDLATRYAKLMGARITCKSNHGEGAEFSFIFKQKLVDKTPLGAFKEKDEKLGHGLYAPRFIAPDAEVLIVDSNIASLNIIKSLLKETKMFIATASTGEECLEKVKFGNYNVVLLDYMLPDINAEEIVAKIHDSKPNLPVYALSSVGTEDEEKYIDKGFSGLLVKPLDSDVLEKTIMSHIPSNIYLKLTDTDNNIDEATLPEDMEWLRDLKELDLNHGIRESGGVSKYLASLRVFMDALDAYANGIEDAYKNWDVKLYTIKIHSLKTSFFVVGAMDLKIKADALEEAGNRNDLDYISENTEEFLSDCRLLYTKLAKLRS